MLTGQNGILTQAQNAKQTTEQSSEKEKLELAVTGAMALSKNLTVENLKAELANCGIPTQSSKFPVMVHVNNKNFAINSSGDILEYKNMTDITGEETSNTMTKDNLDNYLVVPAGFKILNTSDNVTNGIIIEDTRYENTKGSQFVWIPVGDIIKEDKTTVNIKLSRYTFEEDGTPIDQGSNMIEWNYSEINQSPYGNITAKENIESENSGFRKSAITNYGYYIGRYEARDKDATDARTNLSSATNQLVCTPNNYVYNWVTQPQAAKMSRTMYSNTSFQSDLINSYAWDTATLFLQTFDNRTTDKTKKYSRKNSLNSGNIANNGTNVLPNTNNQDIICNVYDISGNCSEWTTETRNIGNAPCTPRGGNYSDSQIFTCVRGGNLIDGIYEMGTFRPILYL